MHVKKNHVWVVAVAHAVKENVAAVVQAKVIVTILVNLLQIICNAADGDIPSAFFLDN